MWTRTRPGRLNMLRASRISYAPSTRIGTTVKEIKGEHVKVRVCRREDCRQQIDGGDRK